MENKEDNKKLKQKDSIKWRTIDWIWVIIFLIYAQVYTVLYKEMVMSVISYVSTFVSITLAAVAIYISVREATKGDQVKDQINIMLGELREKINQMDTKLNNFDPKEFNKEKDFKIDEISEKIKNELQDKFAQTGQLTTDQIIAIVTDRVEKASADLKSSLTIRSNELSGFDNHLKKMNEQKRYALEEEILYQTVEAIIKNNFKSGDIISIAKTLNILSSESSIKSSNIKLMSLLERLKFNDIVRKDDNDDYYRL